MYYKFQANDISEIALLTLYDGEKPAGIIGLSFCNGKKMDKQKKELEATLPEETTVETINNGEALKVTFDSGILFATNSSTVSAASKSALRDLAASLNANPDTDIKIIGHTDNTGKVDYNQTLSEKRAKSVFDYLMEDQGVSSKRMTYEAREYMNRLPITALLRTCFEPPSRNPYPSQLKNGTGSTARNFAIRNNRKQNQERDVRKPGIPFLTINTST